MTTLGKFVLNNTGTDFRIIFRYGDNEFWEKVNDDSILTFNNTEITFEELEEVLAPDIEEKIKKIFDCIKAEYKVVKDIDINIKIQKKCLEIVVDCILSFLPIICNSEDTEENMKRNTLLGVAILGLTCIGVTKCYLDYSLEKERIRQEISNTQKKEELEEIEKMLKKNYPQNNNEHIIQEIQEIQPIEIQEYISKLENKKYMPPMSFC